MSLSFTNKIKRFQHNFNLDEATQCWLWNKCKRDGYGLFCRQNAHRWAYEFVFGSFPEGKQADHLCRNRACVNPFHIEPVTQRENMERGNGKSTQFKPGFVPHNKGHITIPTCHPTRKHHYRGLCNVCYMKRYHATHNRKK